MTENEINQRYLRNNYEHYALNYNDRRIECEKEEKAFEQSEQDNMNYRMKQMNYQKKVKIVLMIYHIKVNGIIII